MAVFMYSIIHMFKDILHMIQAWDIWGQFFFVIIIATLGTGIGMALVGMVGEFINKTLPVLIRGYPKKEEGVDDHK
jgi:hypothetical protein